MKARVMIVDDEEIVRKSCIKLLKPAGLQISEASDAGRAMEKVLYEGFDLVLTDLRLPDRSGIELLKDIKEHSPDTEVILVTGYGTVSTAVEAMKLGAYDYIEKPFRPEELTTLVERALEMKKLKEENIRLRQQLSTKYIKNIVGTSRAVENVFKLIASVAPTISTVLITGESGTGKELVARAIHYNSPRKDKPFVVVDCGTLPGELIESELFGYRKGSFTGAHTDRAGLIEEADSGTLFLDEIGNLPLTLQTKLLRVLQEKEFRPIGEKAAKRVDIRFIAATNKDLHKMVKEGTFREDLFYRLNIFPIHIPPLSERRDDIPLLSYHFLRKYSEETGRPVTGISAEAMRILTSYHWPGNVRELENAIQRAMLLTENSVIRPDDLSFLQLPQGEHVPGDITELKRLKRHLRKTSIENIEKTFIINALRRNNWNITRTAEDVGMQRSNFHALMKKYRISRSR